MKEEIYIDGPTLTFDCSKSYYQIAYYGKPAASKGTMKNKLNEYKKWLIEEQNYTIEQFEEIMWDHIPFKFTLKIFNEETLIAFKLRLM